MIMELRSCPGLEVRSGLKLKVEIGYVWVKSFINVGFESWIRSQRRDLVLRQKLGLSLDLGVKGRIQDQFLGWELGLGRSIVGCRVFGARAETWVESQVGSRGQALDHVVSSTLWLCEEVGKQKFKLKTDSKLSLGLGFESELRSRGSSLVRS